MSPTFQLTLTVPEGTTVTIASLESPMIVRSSVTLEQAVEDYWRQYLSDNSRKVYGAAARIEEVRGAGYTLDDIAQTLSLTYESVRSLHRTSGRTARKWRAEKGVDPPIRLVAIAYPETDTGTRRRTLYQLPPGVADIVVNLPQTGGRGKEH
jgi:hypothetical protein